MGHNSITVESVNGGDMNIIEAVEKLAELRKHSDHQEAVRQALAILERWGPDSEVMRFIGRSTMLMQSESFSKSEEQSKKVIYWLRKAIEHEPTRPEYYTDLGAMIELGLNDYDEALKAYKKALEIEPSHVQALLHIAWMYGVPDAEDLVSIEEAIMCCEKAARIYPTRTIWDRLSELYRCAGRLENAQRASISSLLASNQF